MHRITEPLIQLMSYKALCCFTWETRERQFLQKRIDRCKNVQGWSFKTDRWRPIIFQFFLFKPQNLIFTVVFHQFKTKHNDTNIQFWISNQLEFLRAYFPLSLLSASTAYFAPNAQKCVTHLKLPLFPHLDVMSATSKKKLKKLSLHRPHL